MKSMNIDVNNLCNFMAQDKVSTMFPPTTILFISYILGWLVYNAQPKRYSVWKRLELDTPSYVNI